MYEKEGEKSKNGGKKREIKCKPNPTTLRGKGETEHRLKKHLERKEMIFSWSGSPDRMGGPTREGARTAVLRLRRGHAGDDALDTSRVLWINRWKDERKEGDDDKTRTTSREDEGCSMTRTGEQEDNWQFLFMWMMLILLQTSGLNAIPSIRPYSLYSHQKTLLNVRGLSFHTASRWLCSTTLLLCRMSNDLI